jgi:hypothetical protein
MHTSHVWFRPTLHFKHAYSCGLSRRISDGCIHAKRTTPLQTTRLIPDHVILIINHAVLSFLLRPPSTIYRIRSSWMYSLSQIGCHFTPLQTPCEPLAQIKPLSSIYLNPSQLHLDAAQDAVQLGVAVQGRILYIGRPSPNAAGVQTEALLCQSRACLLEIQTCTTQPPNWLRLTTQLLVCKAISFEFT